MVTATNSGYYMKSTQQVVLRGCPLSGKRRYERFRHGHLMKSEMRERIGQATRRNLANGSGSGYTEGITHSNFDQKNIESGRSIGSGGNVIGRENLLDLGHLLKQADISERIPEAV